MINCYSYLLERTKTFYPLKLETIPTLQYLSFFMNQCKALIYCYLESIRSPHRKRSMYRGQVATCKDILEIISQARFCKDSESFN